MIKKFSKYFLLFYFFGINLFPQTKLSFYNAFDSISPINIKKHLTILASDSLEGRGVGTNGGNLAAKYIAEQFSDFGLEKSFKLNSFYQNIPMHGSISLISSELTLVQDDTTINLIFGDDYFLYRSGQQTYIPVPLPLVFVGYGIVAPEYDYNDYQSVDVENKIVVYFDGEPQSKDDDYFNGNLPTIYSNQETKRRIALSRGAAGTILIPLSKYDDWNSVQKEFFSEDVTLAYSVTGNLNLIMNALSAVKLFTDSKYSYDDVISMYGDNRIKSFPLKTKIKFKGAFKERDFISQNIIGIIPGIDEKLKDTYLIISAHYDHLGIGLPIEGDSVYNGALDNAIGVSVLLELANSFYKLDKKPKRSIVFIATTGEEKGLLGSTYYTDNPVVPLYKTIANVNIDGIAMFKDFESVVGIGAEYSSLDKYLKQTADKFNLIVQNIPDEFRIVGEFNSSDQFAFAMAGIPSILIYEGTKNKSKSEEEVLNAFISYYLEKYHTPFDDLNQNIDFDAAARHAKIIFDFCFNLANSIDTPQWNEGVNFINARLRSIAEKR